MAAPTIQINATQDYLLGASNSFTQSSNTRLQGSNTIAIYNGALPTVAAGGITVQATNALNLSSVNVLVNASNNIQLLTPSTICSGDITAVTFNGAPLPTSGNVTSTFTQLNTNILSNNPAISNDLKIRAANAIVLNDTGETTVSLGGSLEVTGPATGAVNIQTVGFNSLNNFIALTAYNTLDLLSLSSLTVTGQSSINLTSSNINLYTPSTICSGDIRAVTFNGLPLPTSGGGGSVVSTYTQLNTNILSNNPAIGNDLLLRAANAIVMGNNAGFVQISLGDSLDIMGTGGETNIYSQVLNSLNSIISFSAYNTLDLASVSSLTVTGQSSINVTSSNIIIDAPAIDMGGAVNANCNAISNVGTFSRYLISTELPQPVIQYEYVSTAAAFSGAVTITLPQRYTSVNSYIPFAVVQNDVTTTFYVSTITRATFEIGWSGYTGFSDIIFSWNTLGT
jgi:hypothetical protein